MAFLFLFKRRSVFYDGMKSEANEMTNGRNIQKNLTVVKKKTISLFRAFTFVFVVFYVQFNLAKLFGLKSITIIFLNIKFDVSKARTWKGMDFLETKILLVQKMKILICGFQVPCLFFFRNFTYKNMPSCQIFIYKNMK